MKSKTKIMSIAAASLACVAIAGVGFASWVITGDIAGEVDGNVKVETVSDERIMLSAELVDSIKAINYTYKSNPTGTTWREDGKDWLIQNSLDGEALSQENLSVIVKLTIDGFDNIGSTGSIDFKISLNDETVRVVEYDEDGELKTVTFSNNNVTYTAYYYDDGEDGIIYGNTSTNTFYIEHDCIHQIQVPTDKHAGLQPSYAYGASTNYSRATSLNLLAGVDKAVVTYKKSVGGVYQDVKTTPVTANNNNGTVSIKKSDVVNNYDDVKADDEKVTIYLEVAFKWGDKFMMDHDNNPDTENQSVNPAQYYNTKYDSSRDESSSYDDIGKEAEAYLEELYNSLNKEVENVWNDIDGDNVVDEGEVAATTTLLQAYYNFLFKVAE